MLPSGGYSIYDMPNDSYITWGDDEKPWNEQNGIILTVDGSSASHSSIDMYVKLDMSEENLSKLDKFYVLANNKIVDVFYPRYFRNAEGKLLVADFYKVKPTNNWLIGGNVNFQVVGVDISDQKGNYFGEEDVRLESGIGWSKVDGLYMMKPLPVEDMKTHRLLENILAMLKKMLQELSALLEKISKQIETMFTPSEQAQKELEEALKDFSDKLPMNQIKDQLDDMSNVMENTPLKPPGSELVFGESKDYFQIGIEFNLWDFTLMKPYIKPFRDLMSAFMWLSFFYFLVEWLLPRLDL